jgi:quinol monooxygenase YgiN
METPTFIAILDFSVSSTDRPAAIAQLEREQPVVRAMPGCIAFRVFPSSETDTDLTVLHEWADRAAFDRYLASDAFARSGEVLRPVMTGPATSRRFQVSLVESAA